MLVFVMMFLLVFIYIQSYDIHVINDDNNAWPHKNIILQKQCITIFDDIFTHDDQKIISNIFLNFRQILDTLCKRLDGFIHHRDKAGMEIICNDIFKLFHNIEPQFHEKNMYFKHSLMIHIKNYTA
jgi:hypothetical protein